MLNMLLSKSDLFAHRTERMSLHYLGNHKPRKLRLSIYTAAVTATDHEEGGVCDTPCSWNDLTSTAVDRLLRYHCVQDLELHVTYC